MLIKGLQKTTLIDYPGKVACTVFLGGCNFRCPWCYSAELVIPEKMEDLPDIKEEEFFEFLQRRKGKLDGVVVCGGEPTVQRGLSEFLKRIKEEGFLVKLDTNGSNPDILEELLSKELLDYIAMDIKAPLDDAQYYREVTGGKADTESIKKSVDIVMNSGKKYEFRSTLVPDIHTLEKVERMARSIEGAERYFLQRFLPEKTLDEEFLRKKPFFDEEMEEFKEKANSYVKMCQVR